MQGGEKIVWREGERERCKKGREREREREREKEREIRRERQNPYLSSNLKVCNNIHFKADKLQYTMQSTIRRQTQSKAENEFASLFFEEKCLTRKVRERKKISLPPFCYLLALTLSQKRGKNYQLTCFNYLIIAQPSSNLPSSKPI